MESAPETPRAEKICQSSSIVKQCRWSDKSVSFFWEGQLPLLGLPQERFGRAVQSGSIAITAGDRNEKLPVTGYRNCFKLPRHSSFMGCSHVSRSLLFLNTNNTKETKQHQSIQPRATRPTGPSSAKVPFVIDIFANLLQRRAATAAVR